MTENPYEEKIKNLLDGDINELLVERDDFFLFREIWINHPQKNQIVGEAGLGGRVIYRKVDE